jgi:hypothetical protein
MATDNDSLQMCEHPWIMMMMMIAAKEQHN